MKKFLSLACVLVFAVLIFAWCSSKNSVKKGDNISIVYTATFPDGKTFDQNTEAIPLMFIVGSWQVIQGLDEGVIGMKVGKTKSITIKPAKWYGKLYDAKNIQKISQLIFDKLSITPTNGTMHNLWWVEWIITGTEKDDEGNVLVLFDINPRQTRDTLKYEITILAKE